MYLIIILECVKSSLDINILKKNVNFFFYKDIMVADEAELEHSNNKCYASTFRNAFFFLSSFKLKSLTQNWLERFLFLISFSFKLN